MPFLEHLAELRSRLARAVIAFIAGAVVCWTLRETLLALVAAPLVAAWEAHRLGPVAQLNWLNPIDGWLGYLKLSLVGGLFLTSPVLLYQLWRFVSPGLYTRERRLVFPFVLFGTLFFVGGAAFGYAIVFPLGLRFFFSLAGQVAHANLEMRPMITLDEYLSFSTQMLVAFGVAFELPVVTTFLAIAGIVTWKQLWRFGRWFAVIAAVVSAILTPPDVASQMLMMVPLMLLYLLSVGLAFLVGRKRERATPG